MVDINLGRPRPGSPEAGLLADMMAANPDNLAALEREARGILARLTPAQLRLLRAMPLRRPKTWRRLYRHAKLTRHVSSTPSKSPRKRDFVQLPFRLAQPLGGGREGLTALGRIAKEMAR